MPESDVRDAGAVANGYRRSTDALRRWKLGPDVRLRTRRLLLTTCASARRQQPARIISLVPAATEMLFAIGAGPRVVAVSSYDKEPPEVRIAAARRRAARSRRRAHPLAASRI